MRNKTRYTLAQVRQRRPSGEAVALLRSQLDERLRKAASLRSIAAPKTGWINAIRSALGMTPRQFGVRLAMTPQGVADLERREASGTITLGTLRKAAAALDADVVVVVLPRTTLEGTVRAQAAAKAAAERNRIAHTMLLEEQAAGTRKLLYSKLLEQEWLTARLGELWD